MLIKKTITVVLVCMSLLSSTAFAHLQSEEYSKWMGMARGAAATQYKEATVIDFLYVGCKATSMTTTEQLFTFWMKDPTHEFAAYVTLVIHNQSRDILETKITESDGIDPAYGKFIRIAEAELMKKYPLDNIVDYRPHVCKAVSESIAIQTFRFWLSEQGIINVTIVHEIKTEKVIRIEMERIWGGR